MPKKISKIRLERLAKDVVDSWDIDMLVEYAIERMTAHLSSLTKIEFEGEWDNYYGDDSNIERGK